MKMSRLTAIAPLLLRDRWAQLMQFNCCIFIAILRLCQTPLASRSVRLSFLRGYAGNTCHFSMTVLYAQSPLCDWRQILEKIYLFESDNNQDGDHLSTDFVDVTTGNRWKSTSMRLFATSQDNNN
jgi:hypothetical protein